jgi:hypothetical protein
LPEASKKESGRPLEHKKKFDAETDRCSSNVGPLVVVRAALYRIKEAVEDDPKQPLGPLLSINSFEVSNG